MESDESSTSQRCNCSDGSSASQRYYYRNKERIAKERKAYREVNSELVREQRKRASQLYRERNAEILRMKALARYHQKKAGKFTPDFVMSDGMISPDLAMSHSKID